MIRPALALCCFTIVAYACRPNTTATTSAEPSATTSSLPSAAVTASAEPAPSASVASPAGSVPLADAPDVRVTIPTSATAVVKVGQTFGILVPHPEDFLDEWELDGAAPLGEPLTTISRGDIGRELLWKIADENVGKHEIKLRRMHRATRTSRPTPAGRAIVTVDVVRS